MNINRKAIALSTAYPDIDPKTDTCFQVWLGDKLIILHGDNLS